MSGCCALLPPYPLAIFGSTQCTNSWITKDIPIAVMRKVNGRAPRRRSGRYATASRPSAVVADTAMATSMATPRYSTVSDTPLL
ncbi:Uncharacterised protein [Mycobacteroides abscessus subsp. abscessus]|nr:Uncharacterised protein [Mycobacteroides abscessus subsp. abscessus]